MDETLKNFAAKVARKMKEAHMNKEKEVIIDFDYNKNIEYQTAFYELTGDIARQYVQKYNNIENNKIQSIDAGTHCRGIKIIFNY